MPRVPTLNQRSVVTKTGPTAYADPNAPAAAFGAASAKATVELGGKIIQVGETVHRAGQIIKAEDDEREFRKLETEYSNFLRTQRYGDGTPKNPGFENLEGENAVNAFPSYQQTIIEKQKELLERASNQQVREKFGIASDQRTNTTLSTALNKVGNERHRANDATTDARIAEAIDASTQAWSDNKELNQNLAIIDSEIASKGARKGWSADKIEHEKEKARSLLFSKMIGNALYDDPKAAERLFLTHQTEIDGVSQAAIKQAIRARKTQVIADQEREERARLRKQKEFQKANYSDLMVRAVEGTLNMHDAIGAMSAQAITPEQFKAVKKMSEAGDVTIDPQLFIDTQLAVLYGNMDMTAVAEKDGLGRKDKEKLIKLAASVEKEGGVLASQKFKDAREHIKLIVTGFTGPIANITDPLQRARLANAMLELQDAAMKGRDITEARDAIAKAYAPARLASPSQQLLTVGRPKTWAGTMTGTKEQLLDRFNKARARLKNLESSMHTTELRIEIERLLQVKAIIDTMEK